MTSSKLVTQSAVPLLVAKLLSVTVELVARVVNAPDDLVLAPIAVPLILPPVIVALMEEKLLAVTAPARLTLSRFDPMLIVSALVLSVPILTVLPALPVAILIVRPSRLRAVRPFVPRVPPEAKVILVGVVAIVLIELTPERLPAFVTFRPVDVREKSPIALPIVTFPAVPRLVSPDEVKVVNAAVDGVVAPIAVLLIPVAVAAKLLLVMSKSFAPVEMFEADKPVKLRTPEMAVKLIFPVVWVSPLLAVRSPAEVIVPVPDVLILPLVARKPFSLTVNVSVPFA